MERELEKDLKEIEYLIYVHKNRGNTNTQSVLERVHEIIEPCAKAARTLSELEELLSRENGPEITRSSRDNDGWMSVEERLPKTNGTYNVTRHIDGHFISDSAYFDGQNTWHSDNRVNHSRPYLTDVIAWRPLPEPYHPERSVH